MNHVCEVLNIFVLLDKFFCLILNENLLLLNFLSRFFHLVEVLWNKPFTYLLYLLHLRVLSFKSEQYFCTLDFCTFTCKRRPPWFVCLVYSLTSNIFHWVLFSFYGTTGDRTKLALNLHSWKTIYLKTIALFLSSFWCTTFIFFSLRCNISSGGEKIIRFLLFEFVLRVFFAEDFSIRIDEVLLKRNFFNELLLFFETS